MYNLNGESASNTSDTQYISPVHLPTETFLEPDDMEATIEVETPPIHERSAALPPPDAQPTPDNPWQPAPLPTGDVPRPQQEAREPYYSHPLPCSYPLLWQSHHEECLWLRGVLLTMFTVLILAMAAVLFSLMIFVATGIVLCLVFLLMIALKKKDAPLA
jgi:hypothetical protein